MAINKESNAFTFIFAIAMVVVVGSLLALAAMGLKPRQTENMKKEKMKDILKAARVDVEMDQAPEFFNKYVNKRVVLSYEGKVITETTGDIDVKDKQEAFNIEIRKEYKAKPVDKRLYPLYILEKEGQTLYVIPMVGKGLWGPVWGYIALENDFNTVYGAVFDHKTETPGLGAEINTWAFQEQFVDKKIFTDEGKYVSIQVVKPGKVVDQRHAVDGITGGTITSQGVGEMLFRTLDVYRKYFEKSA